MSLVTMTAGAFAPELTVVLVAAGCVAVVFGLYLVVLSVAAHFYSDPVQRIVPTSRVVVLIPAHDERLLISDCVSSLLNQTYPRALYRIAVIADNCTDDTAMIAGGAGADVVMTRRDPAAHGKGQALRWAMDQILHEEHSPDAVIVVDADTIASPEMIEALVRRLEAGADAVQGEYLLSGDGSSRSELRALAFRLVNSVRPAGRTALGGSAQLVGNGMLLSRNLLLANPWSAFTSTEDLEYSLNLRMQHVRIMFAADAKLRSPTAPNARVAAAQQLRWEGGRAYLARRWIGRLAAAALRGSEPSLMEAAFELAIPPLGFLAAASLVGLGCEGAFVVGGVLPAWTLVPWLVALVSLPAYVLIGLSATPVPPAAYRVLLHAPLFIAAKPLSAYRVLRFRANTWVRTARGPRPNQE
jgi:hypothetical protein